MNKLLVIFMLSFSTLIGLNAQTAPSEVCTSPTSYNYDEEVTWYFNLTGNTSVTAGQDLYFYSWAPTSIPPTLMTYENNMLWSLTFTPTTLYGVTVAEIETEGAGAFWNNIQNSSGTNVTGTTPFNLKEKLRLGSSCSGIAPSSSDSTFLVNFGSEPIANPDTNLNYWTNVETKAIDYDLTDKGGTGRYQITATGGFTANNNSGFTNPDASILGDMAIANATKSYLFLSGSGTGTVTISGLDVTRLHKLSIFGSRNTTSTRETRYTVKGLNTESGVIQTSGTGIATNPTLNANDDEFYIVNAFPNAQGEIDIDVEIVSGGFGYINMLKIEEILSPTLTFDGSTDSDWGTAANWENNVLPSALYSTIIPASQNVTISGTTNALTKDLTINNSGSLTINAGGSLIVNGTSTGNVTYNRTLDFIFGNANGWHLVSSPVSGEVFDNAFATSNSIASGTSNNLGIANYNSSGNSWIYLESPSGSISSTSGLGYSMKRSATGAVAFTGTINTDNVNGVPVSAVANEFVLLGNPYTSYISSQTFLGDNTNLDQSQIWVWEQGVTGGNYIANTAKGDNFILAPGQGFFVKKATTVSTVNFSKSNQATNADTFKKSSRTEVKLFMNDGESNRFAKLYYVNNVTKGFDAGWEGETFGGIKNSLEVFSQLVEGNQGKNYQVQSLPISEMEFITVPIGIKAAAGKEIMFSTEALNLPTDLKVFLEDRENNTMTRLDEVNSNYTVTLNNALDGVGRFYLYTKSSSVLSVDSFNLDNISIYTTNKYTIRIVGLSQGKSSIKLFNILGKQVLNSSFVSNGVYDVNLPKLTTGVYIVQLKNENGTLNKKIILE
jgi:hypothetical protein